MTKKRIKLTPSQEELLAECAQRPQKVIRGFKPAVALEKLGLVSLEPVDTKAKVSFQLTATITPAGERYRKGRK